MNFTNLIQINRKSLIIKQKHINYNLSDDAISKNSLISMNKVEISDEMKLILSFTYWLLFDGKLKHPRSTMSSKKKRMLF